jgi:hypothetical protein
LRTLHCLTYILHIRSRKLFLIRILKIILETILSDFRWVPVCLGNAYCGRRKYWMILVFVDIRRPLARRFLIFKSKSSVWAGGKTISKCPPASLSYYEELFSKDSFPPLLALIWINFPIVCGPRCLWMDWKLGLGNFKRWR